MSGQRHGVIIPIKGVDFTPKRVLLKAIKKQNTGMALRPNPTYKKEVDELVPHKERMDWKRSRNNWQRLN